jgi:hypothetical protein
MVSNIPNLKLPRTDITITEVDEMLFLTQKQMSLLPQFFLMKYSNTRGSQEPV